MQAGEKFSHYVVLRKLGQGGMGEVYLAEDTSLDRKVALKVLPEGSAEDFAARERFIREARAAAAIDHPYICKVYEAGVCNQRPFISMEFVEGETLLDRLSGGPVPLKEGLHVGVEIAEALSRAHEKGVVHRDLKPSNIMLTRDGHVKVVDFGLAKRVLADDAETISVLERSRSQPGSLMGTLNYMSPEQLRTAPVDHRTDIFSLGVIFYEMFSGCHPFRKGSAMETAGAILREPPEPLSMYSKTCPPFLEQIVSKMLCKELAGRYTSARELLGNLRELQEKPEPTAPQLRPVVSSIAVLPFVNRSADKDNEYFSDGITEDIIAEISKISDLRVISRTSVMRYKGVERDLKEVGRELGVQTILEGSVRRAGARVRIVSTLIDVEADRHLWAETYDRNMEDIFAIQSEVSRHIAIALKANLAPLRAERQRRDESRQPEAYSFYLRGRFFMNKLTPEGIQQGIQYFKKVLEIDPNSARSYAGIATCFANAGHFGFLPLAESFPEAKVAAQRALELDENLAEAHASMALVKLFYDWDWDGAERGFTRAIELNPNFAEAHTLYSWYLIARKRFPEAIREAQEAVQLDPLSIVANTNLGWVLAFAGRYDEGIEQTKKAIEMDPNFLPGVNVLGYIYLLQGAYGQGVPLIEKSHWDKAHLGQAYAVAGQHDAARAVLKEIADPSFSGLRSPLEISLLCFLLGELDQGFEWLERAYEAHDNRIVYLRNFAELHHIESCRADPRYATMVRRLGLEP